MAKKKVFVSFDYDNDKALKDLLVGQSRNSDSPFEISDHSLKEERPEANWLEYAKAAIGRAEVFLIMVGKNTKTASGVLKELAVAIEKDKTKFQILGSDDVGASDAVPGGGTAYRWTWENLKKLLA